MIRLDSVKDDGERRSGKGEQTAKISNKTSLDELSWRKRVKNGRNTKCNRKYKNRVRKRLCYNINKTKSEDLNDFLRRRSKEKQTVLVDKGASKLKAVRRRSTQKIRSIRKFNKQE